MQVAERAEVLVAATVGVAPPTTAVAFAAETEAAATRQALRQVVELPAAVRAVVLGDLTGGMATVVLRAVKVDAGVAQVAVQQQLLMLLQHGCGRERRPG